MTGLNSFRDHLARARAPSPHHPDDDAGWDELLRDRERQHHGEILGGLLSGPQVPLDSDWDESRPATRAKLRELDVAGMVRTAPPPVPWVVEGLVAKGMVTLVNGREGEGKSLLAYSLAAGVATGHAEAGMDCPAAGGVVIVDAENGAYEIHRRVHTLDLPPRNITIIEAEGFDLRYDLDELSAVLERHRPRLLVLDSFRSLWGGKENDSDEVARVLDPLRNLVRRLDVGTKLIHHSSRGDHGDYRGSSAIGACVELGFKLARDKDDVERDRRYLDCWKCRPAPEPPRRWLRLALERGRVYDDEAEPPEGAEPDRGGRPPIVRETLRPGLIETLTDEPQPRAALARAVGREPKDRSLRRVLDQLLEEEIAAKVEDDNPPTWKRGRRWRNPDTPTGPGGFATTNEAGANLLTERASGGGTAAGHEQGETPPTGEAEELPLATDEEQELYERLARKHGEAAT